VAAVILPVLVVCALSGIERAKATKAEFDKLQGEWVLESISGWDGDKVVTRPGGKKRMTITKDR
jgi:hypothetical protein